MFYVDKSETEILVQLLEQELETRQKQLEIVGTYKSESVRRIQSESTAFLNHRIQVVSRLLNCFKRDK